MTILSNKKSSIIKFILIVCIIVSFCIPSYYIVLNKLKGTELNMPGFMLGALFSFIVTACIASANFTVFAFVKKKLPWQKDNKKRIIIELLLTSFNASVIIVLIILVFNYFFENTHTCDVNFRVNIFENIIIANIVNLIVMSILEGIFIFEQWKQSILESEKLMREKAESQYAALKSQINPHFLFNSLNTLSSLITTSPDKAVEFTNRFSKIYRYVLDVSEKVLVELKEEIQFINNYCYLQKIRFNDNLIIDIKIEAKELNTYVPPLSLQFLIENAIKHNEISNEKPLTISVSCDVDYLIVRNVLQNKISVEPQSGIGLNNLKERYAHFTDLKPEFYISGKEYIAKIPLLKENE